MRQPADRAGERVANDAADAALLRQRIFAPYKLATLIEVAADHGIASGIVLAGTSLTAEAVHDPHARTSVHDYITACENVVAADATPGIAFDVGARMHLSAYGMYGYALMCSPTLRAFCDFAVRYHLLATPFLGLGWREEGGRAVWHFPEIHADAMSDGVRRFLVRQQMMMTATHMRDIWGGHVTPLHAAFALDDMDPEASERLGCACAFGAPAHELHYPSALLDQPPQFANSLTYAWLEETCDDLIDQLRAPPSLAGEIYQRLVRASHVPPSMAAIARDMGVTERTLRRRLVGEGASFAAIADDARRRLTLRYLETTRMSADDIAAAVGFSDTANLRRAVKRWTGRTFGEMRQQV